MRERLILKSPEASVSVPAALLYFNADLIRDMFDDCHSVPDGFQVLLPMQASKKDLECLVEIITPPCHVPKGLGEKSILKVMELADFLSIRWLYDKLEHGPPPPSQIQWPDTYTRDGLIKKMVPIIKAIQSAKSSDKLMHFMITSNHVLSLMYYSGNSNWKANAGIQPLKASMSVNSQATWRFLRITHFECIRHLIMKETGIVLPYVKDTDHNGQMLLFHYKPQSKELALGYVGKKNKVIKAPQALVEPPPRPSRPPRPLAPTAVPWHVPVLPQPPPVSRPRGFLSRWLSMVLEATF